MEFATKYNINQKVFFLADNAIHQGCIQSVFIYAYNDSGYLNRQSVHYNIECYEKALKKKYQDVEESLIFHTKEELIEYLTQQ